MVKFDRKHRRQIREIAAEKAIDLALAEYGQSLKNVVSDELEADRGAPAFAFDYAISSLAAFLGNVITSRLGLGEAGSIQLVDDLQSAVAGCLVQFERGRYGIPRNVEVKND